MSARDIKSTITVTRDARGWQIEYDTPKCRRVTWAKTIGDAMSEATTAMLEDEIARVSKAAS